MVNEVKAQSPKKSGKRHLDEIRVKRAANGFAIHKRYTGGEKEPYMERDEPPAVFTKHSQAHKHLKSALAEMHAPDNEATEGETQESQEGE